TECKPRYWEPAEGGVASVRERREPQAFPQRVLQRVEAVVGSGAAGHEGDRVAALGAHAAVASAQSPHPVAVHVDGEAEAPLGVEAEHLVRAGELRGDRFGEYPGAEQGARVQCLVEARYRGRRSVAVDGGDLRGPPGRAVDHGAVLRAGRVGDGPLVQWRAAGRVGGPERVVQSGQVYRPGL